MNPGTLPAPETVQDWLHDGEEIAFFDVREQGQYGSAHPFFAVPLAYSRLELEVERLAPRRDVRVVLVDDDEVIAAKAQARLEKLGYRRVLWLGGGVGAWKEAGFPLFAGVHVPSKAFGELAEHAYATPSVSAGDLAAMIDRRDDLLILDGRPISEYGKMNIPGAYCCPNGELPLRVHRMVPNEKTTIVVNCAGRTRSIIGAQSLINLGIVNPVLALENGTQGWALEGLELERGAGRHYPPLDDGTGSRQAHPLRVSAEALAARCGVQRVDAETVKAWLAEPARTTFLLDVRTPEEHEQETLPGAASAPGGQLLQSTDLYVGVRKARVVLFDDDDVRAFVTASWLRQMGHDAYVLEGGLRAGLQASLSGPQPQALPAALPSIDAGELASLLESEACAVVDVRSSMDFRRGHIPGSIWSIRPRIAAHLAGELRPIVLISDEPGVAELAVGELAQDQQRRAQRLHGGFSAWRAAGAPVASTPDQPADGDCIDYLFFVHDRHAGNLEAARQYLAWEMGLVQSLHPRDRSVFRLAAPPTPHETAPAT
jgi:rhodanese-related sulfurtransferase